MKRLAVVIFVLILFNCEKKDEDCKCDMEVSISDGTDVSTYTITNVPHDCNGNVTADLDLPSNHFPSNNCK